MGYKELDELLSSKARLGIMAILAAAEEVEFTYLKEKLDLTDGNLSTHMKKLEEAGYILSEKAFFNKKPRTSYRITPTGRTAFERHLSALEKILKGEV